MIESAKFSDSSFLKMTFFLVSFLLYKHKVNVLWLWTKQDAIIIIRMPILIDNESDCLL